MGREIYYQNKNLENLMFSLKKNVTKINNLLFKLPLKFSNEIFLFFENTKNFKIDITEKNFKEIKYNCWNKFFF